MENGQPPRNDRRMLANCRKDQVFPLRIHAVVEIPVRLAAGEARRRAGGMQRGCSNRCPGRGNGSDHSARCMLPAARCHPALPRPTRRRRGHRPDYQALPGITRQNRSLLLKTNSQHARRASTCAAPARLSGALPRHWERPACVGQRAVMALRTVSGSAIRRMFSIPSPVPCTAISP